MKTETKVKLKTFGGKVWNFTKEWFLPAFGFATIGAAWSGHTRAKQLEQELERTKEVIDNNARCQQHDRDKLLELEHQQTILFETALRVTEGKAD